MKKIKRIIDFIFALLLIVLLSPIFLVIASLIKISSRGPILYNWDVVGKNGISFRGYKFRTMQINADDLKSKLINSNEMKGPVFKMKNDPRITTFGKVLRKYSLDELPQLLSVIKGDMSLVGPRPAGINEWKHYKDWHKRKLSVTPGMTCLWQVNGRNEIVDFDDWVKMDIEYIENWSLWLDIKILIKTFFVVLRGTGR